MDQSKEKCQFMKATCNAQQPKISAKDRPLAIKQELEYIPKYDPHDTISLGSINTPGAKVTENEYVSIPDQRYLNETRQSSGSASSSYDRSSFLFNFTSLRTSAGYVVETIREKLSYFRRSRSANYSSKPKLSCQPRTTDYNIPPIKSGDEVPSKFASDRPLVVSETSNASAIYSFDDTIVDTSNLLLNTKLSEEKCETVSLYDNDYAQVSIERRKDFSAASDQLNTESSVFGFNDSRLVQDEHPQMEKVSSTEQTQSSLCSPCIGSKTFEKETGIMNDQEQDHGQNKCNIPIPAEESIAFCKVVYNQPANNQMSSESITRSPQEASPAEVSPGEAIAAEESNSADTQRPHVIDIPSVKLQFASPSCSINQELNLKSDSHENPSQSDDKSLQLNESNSQTQLNTIPVSGKKHLEAIKDDVRAAQNGIKLWDLRNSLEQTTIEIQCALAAYDDFEDNKDRRFSTTTDGMTEPSPLSTPSSEATNFRGKSMSDSEDDCRAYYVTPSGRLSPRQPNFCQKSSHTFSSSPERVCYDQTNNIECCFAPVETVPIWPRNHCRSPDMNSVDVHKNILVTTATIEHPKCSDIEATALFPSDKSSQKTEFSTCQEKRNKFLTSQKWSTVSDSEDFINAEPPVTRWSKTSSKNRKSSGRILRQESLPLASEHSCIQVHDRIEEHPNANSYPVKSESKNDRKNLNLSTDVTAGHDYTTSNSPLKKNYLRNSQSVSSDDVFLNDSPGAFLPSSLNQYQNDQQQNYKHDYKSNSSNFHHSTRQKCSPNNSMFPLANCDISVVTSNNKINQRPKFRTKRGSATSSGTSSPTSPISSSEKRPLRSTKSVDMESDGSVSSQTSSSRSSSSLKSWASIFRRGGKNRIRSDSTPTFYGYSMERDYCVDPETDRVFKEFLSLSSPTIPAASLPSGEPLPPPHHMVPPPPLKQTSSAQLRRQVMRKQYSDTIAMYYGQRQRKWRFTKQKSDSINCPIDRGTFRRQDRIDEEFDPEEINERLSSTSSHRESEKTDDFVPPTVNELKEWRRSSEDRSVRALHHTCSLPISSAKLNSPSQRSTRRVTFKQNQFEGIKSRSQDVS